MANYESALNALGLEEWCSSEANDGPVTMAELLARAGAEKETSAWDIPFPSLDTLNKACPPIPRARDMTDGVEQAFIDIKNPLKAVLDPLTEPLSWALDGSLALFQALPWYVLIPLLLLLVWAVTRSGRLVGFVAVSFLFLSFVDLYVPAIQTLSIIFVCTAISVLLGVPIGILMARSNTLQRILVPVLDMLQTLPTFVYLIPLIYLFSVTESKLYGIAIILYAVVPVVRLTNLGIRLVDRDVIEAADAFGMTARQKLLGVQIPLALPNIMAGVNQTIMMSLAMVVIASLVSAPGLGVLVLQGIRELELGVGLVSGFAIVLLAIILDRVTKASLARINTTQSH
ncbi:glycine/betaine ABC transporter permease [Actibacterium mucosum KCTC 23349]|uniref:Glycine/betaine ABC transporter permease n=1 Tax=Actibacterium mucosum KCTC 23349 TaxID=1454373 RepID=A0A037ZIM3_9RHOB|nr:ABC transporter permease subunit [Actibacterium mucosum]KAJ55469.1 glycine/betaine ABC transporter permease [Actibacterium mucosum KCTC 23349]